ncbi:hypothetical protein [Anaerotignum faecicola]
MLRKPCPSGNRRICSAVRTHTPRGDHPLDPILPQNLHFAEREKG